MDIAVKKNGAQQTIALEGRLDTLTSPQLEDVIKEIPEDITELIFDMEKLEYISSSGLRVLLIAQKKMNRKGTMKLIKVDETVLEILEITGFSGVLTVE